jgi:hypothetical protein
VLNERLALWKRSKVFCLKLQQQCDVVSGTAVIAAFAGRVCNILPFCWSQTRIVDLRGTFGKTQEMGYQSNTFVSSFKKSSQNCYFNKEVILVFNLNLVHIG